MKKLDGLHTLNFNPKAIKVSQDVKAEMDQLEVIMLSPLPVIAPPVFLTGSISIALLNIRSVITKLPDINQDIILKFETWLTHDQNSQLFSDHQVIARSDCVTVISKGGVIIAIHDAIQVAHMTNFLLSYIPYCNLNPTKSKTLPSHSGVSVTQYSHYRILNYSLVSSLNSSMPNIILGDFIEDLLAKSDLQLPNFMSIYGFHNWFAVLPQIMAPF